MAPQPPTMLLAGVALFSSTTALPDKVLSDEQGISGRQRGQIGFWTSGKLWRPLHRLYNATGATAPMVGDPEALPPPIAKEPLPRRPTDSAGRQVRTYGDVGLRREGVGVGKRNEVALMVMTKDDVPLLSRWLIYHGHLFGYEHLYVFDGSTGKQKAYLLWTAKHFPIHVHHRLVDLNSISKRLVAWMSEIKDRYQWIMKVDTDEFVAYAPGGKLDAASTSFHLPAGTTAVNLAVERVLHPEPVKSGSPTDSERGSIENLTWFKHIYSGPQFKASTFNLGSHCFNPTAPAPGLAIVHYPRSYDEMVRMATQVIISHKYIHATDNSSEIIRKLTKLSHKYTRPQCPISSCHKTWRVLDYLKDPDKMRSAYYLQHGKQPAILRDFRNYLREIFVLYPSLLQWAEPATANSHLPVQAGAVANAEGGGVVLK